MNVVLAHIFANRPMHRFTKNLDRDAAVPCCAFCPMQCSCCSSEIIAYTFRDNSATIFEAVTHMLRHARRVGTHVPTHHCADVPFNFNNTSPLAGRACVGGPHLVVLCTLIYLLIEYGAWRRTFVLQEEVIPSDVIVVGIQGVMQNKFDSRRG